MRREDAKKVPSKRSRDDAWLTTASIVRTSMSGMLASSSATALRTAETKLSGSTVVLTAIRGRAGVSPPRCEMISGSTTVATR